MIIKNLSVNQLRTEAWNRYPGDLNAIDPKDLEAYSKLLADDSILRFNNNETMKGKITVLEGLGYYWSSFDQR